MLHNNYYNIITCLNIKNKCQETVTEISNRVIFFLFSQYSPNHTLHDAHIIVVVHSALGYRFNKTIRCLKKIVVVTSSFTAEL